MSFTAIKIPFSASGQFPGEGSLGMASTFSEDDWADVKEGYDSMCTWLWSKKTFTGHHCMKESC